MNDGLPEIKSVFQETSWKPHVIGMLIRVVLAAELSNTLNIWFPFAPAEEMAITPHTNPKR
jgi:hypothetical protein